MAGHSQSEQELYHTRMDAIGLLDGREVFFTHALAPFLSEGALHRYRGKVLIEAFIALTQSGMPHAPSLTEQQIVQLRLIPREGQFDATAVADYDHFGRKPPDRKETVLPMEHDASAAITYVREQLRLQGMSEFTGFIGFPMTSEDLNNLAWNLMLRDAMNEAWLPAARELMDGLAADSRRYADIPVTGRTHGMKASPTTIGKRFSYTLEQFCDVIEAFGRLTLTGKFGGAVGNHNAMTAVLPEFDMEAFARTFVESLGFRYEENANQRNSHRAIKRLLDELETFNIWLIDLCENIRHSVMLEFLFQVGEEHHIGSTAMPHKINPWFFEVAQGILEHGNAIMKDAPAGLLMSVFERDLTDHPWERSYGEMIGSSLAGIGYVVLGLETLRVSEETVRAELQASWPVLSEAVQIAGRLLGIPDAYDTIKRLTRGKPLTGELLRQIIQEQLPNGEIRDRLLHLTPETYVGKAASVARRTVARYEALSPILQRGFFDPLNRIGTVLFDFDGTLQVGDKDELHARLSAISERLNMGFTDEEIVAFGNRSDYQEMRQLMVAEFNHRNPERVQNGNPLTEIEFTAANSEVSGQFDHRFRLADGVHLLHDVLFRTNRTLGLVTTRGANSLPRLLETYGLDATFSVIINRTSCEERKPHPKPLALALEHLGVTDPSTVMYIGDNQVDDVIAGNALGVTTVLVNPAPLDPYGARPTYHVPSLRHLVRLFSRPA